MLHSEYHYPIYLCPIPVQIYLYQRIEVRRVLSMALLVIAEANHVRKAVSTVNDSVNEEC